MGHTRVPERSLVFYWPYANGKKQLHLAESMTSEWERHRDNGLSCSWSSWAMQHVLNSCCSNDWIDHLVYMMQRRGFNIEIVEPFPWDLFFTTVLNATPILIALWCFRSLIVDLCYYLSKSCRMLLNMLYS